MSLLFMVVMLIGLEDTMRKHHPGKTAVPQLLAGYERRENIVGVQAGSHLLTMAERNSHGS